MGEHDKRPVWLPIDAKFPMEDYQRLLEAQDRADPLAVELAAKALEMRLRDEAKKIRDKYVEPPYTTDFAILYLPTEGLYAEALRRAGLADGLQRDFRISIAGPDDRWRHCSTACRWGFVRWPSKSARPEVWAVLGAVKTEFGRFGEALESTRKKLEQATKSIESAVRANAPDRAQTERRRGLAGGRGTGSVGFPGRNRGCGRRGMRTKALEAAFRATRLPRRDTGRLFRFENRRGQSGI